MSIYSLWIINKAGGLVYNKTLNPGLPQLSQNEALVMAGTLHGIHAITGKLSPVDGRGEGVEVIEGDGVKMILFLTGTGTKFVLITSSTYPTPFVPSTNSSIPNATPARILLTKIYEAYSDAVMKNPFHTPEMPIRNEGFDARVEQIVKASAVGGGTL